MCVLNDAPSSLSLSAAREASSLAAVTYMVFRSGTLDSHNITIPYLELSDYLDLHTPQQPPPPPLPSIIRTSWELTCFLFLPCAWYKHYYCFSNPAASPDR